MNRETILKAALFAAAPITPENMPIIAGGTAGSAGAPPAVPLAAAAQTAAPAAQAPPPAASMLPDVVGSWSGYFEALAIVCFALAVLWAVLWLLKKKGGVFSGGPCPMRIEGRMALGPKKWLMVAKVGERRLVLGVTEQNISLLTELEAAPAAPKGGAFAEALRREETAAKTAAAAPDAAQAPQAPKG